MSLPDRKTERVRRQAGQAALGITGGPEEAVEALPTDPRLLQDWIAEQERRLKELRDIESRFLVTRDTQLLNEFMPQREVRRINVREKLDGKACIFDHVRYLAHAKAHGIDGEALIKQDDADIKRLFPHVKIQQVTALNGEPRTAYIGAETKEIEAGLRLLHEERACEMNARQGKEMAGKLAAIPKLPETPGSPSSTDRPRGPAASRRFL